MLKAAFIGSDKPKTKGHKQLTKKGTMQTETSQTEKRNWTLLQRSRRWLSWKTFLGIGCVTLLATGALALAFLNPALPVSPKFTNGFADRVAWYIQHDQFKADLQTAAYSIHYVFSGPAKMQSVLVQTNPPVAGNSGVTPPKS